MWQSRAKSCTGRHAPALDEGFTRDWNMTRRRRKTGWLASVTAIGSDLSLERYRRRPRARALATWAGLLASASAAPAVATQIYTIDVAAGRAEESLSALSMQTSLTISLEEADADSAVTRAVSGSFSAAAALSGMLSGSGLIFAFVGPTTVEVRRGLGTLHWYDIPASPALDGIADLADTLHWEILVDDEDAIDRMRTSAVHGCLSPDAAARELFASTQFTYEWVKPDGAPEYPVMRSLTVRATRPSLWERLFRRPPWRSIFPESDVAQCHRLCTEPGSETLPPGVCVRYAVQSY